MTFACHDLPSVSSHQLGYEIKAIPCAGQSINYFVTLFQLPTVIVINNVYGLFKKKLLATVTEPLNIILDRKL
jgi:hypothetical protein